MTLLDNDPVHLRVILNDPWKAALALWPTFPLNVAMSAVGGASRSAASAQRGLLRDQDRWPWEWLLPVVQCSRSWLRKFKPAVDDDGRIGKVLGEPFDGC